MSYLIKTSGATITIGTQEFTPSFIRLVNITCLQEANFAELMEKSGDGTFIIEKDGNTVQVPSEVIGNLINLAQGRSSNIQDLTEEYVAPLKPSTSDNLNDVISSMSNNQQLDLTEGDYVISSKIILPTDKDIIINIPRGSSIGYGSWGAAKSANDYIFYQGDSAALRQYRFVGEGDIKYGRYGIRSKSSAYFGLDGVNFQYCGWDGQGLSTVNAEAGGVLGYDSSQADLQNFWGGGAGANVLNGGAVRIEKSINVLATRLSARENLRGFRFQDCGIGGKGLVFDVNASNNIESGLYLASSSYTSSAGCENFLINNYVSNYNSNNGVLVIGGKNNTVGVGEALGNWSAGCYFWYPTNNTWQVGKIYNNGRSQYNGIGNNGDAISNFYVYFDNDNLRSDQDFLAKVAEADIQNTGLGTNIEKVAIKVAHTASVSTDNYTKNIIQFANSDLNNQDVGIDLSECDCTMAQVIIDNNVFTNNNDVNIRMPQNGTPIINHTNNFTTLKKLDISLDSSKSQLMLKEGPNGMPLPTRGINSIRAIADGANVKITDSTLTNSLYHSIPVSGISASGYLVNSVLSQALTQVNDLFTNTTEFTSGGDPVTNLTLSGSDLTIILQSGQSYTADVTALGVDEDKFVEGVALNGSNLELTMNDSSVLSISVSNMINGSTLPAVANDWLVAYGGISGAEITTPVFTNSIKNAMPIYNGKALEVGKEFIWNHDDSGTIQIGTWQGATNNASGTSTSDDVNWAIKLKIEGDSSGGGRNIVCPVTDATVTTHSVGVDIDSRYPSGYSITSSTVFSIRYELDNFLYFYDISNGDYNLICKSSSVLDGNPIFLHAGGQAVAVQARIPVLIERFSDWSIVHDFDNSETSIVDGAEQDTVLKSNIFLIPGEKLLVNMDYIGRNESIGLSYSGASSGVNNAYTNIGSRLFYNAAELLRAVFDGATGGEWTWNTSAANHYDPNGDGSNVGYWNGSGVNLGLISFRYQSNNIMELWHETNGEKIATLTAPLDGSDIHFYVGFNEAHPYNRIPTISKQTIGQGPQPITVFAPDISNQSFDITEGDSFNVQIALDSGSDIVNIYGEEDAPSWAVLNQSTGIFNGTAPAYNGSSDSYVINCKAANALGGITSFTITLNVQELVYTNTKSLKFVDGVSSYLGGNAALVTALERSTNGDGNEWTIAFPWKAGSSTQGQTLFYFGHNDIANNGHIEIKQVQGTRLRIRYGTNNNYLQWLTPIDSLSNSSFNWIQVSFAGGSTGNQQGQLSNYYSELKIHINGALQTTTNSQNNYGYTGSVIGQNFRFGKLVSGQYPKDGILNKLTIWSSDQSSNALGLYNGGVNQNILDLAAGVGNMNTNYLPPDHHYEIETSVSLIQDLVGNAHLIGYNFSSSDLVNDAPA